MRGKQQGPGSGEEAGRGLVRATGLGAGTRVGDWRLLGQSAEGSFGVVYLAVRVGEEAAGPCALKLARARGDARLEREVELLSRVSHPNVPRLRGHGEWYGLPYVVMDWVEGATLYRWARQSNPSRREVTRLLAKVAGALAAVHAVGGAHRDMKGENVLVRLGDGEPFLTDFGAGTWEGAAPVTVGGPPGTPQYYSPERLRAHLNPPPPGAPSGAGAADDVYGLGVAAYRLLTDTYPFTEEEEARRTQERLQGSVPKAPQQLNPGVPEPLGALVSRMMSARPEERPPAEQVTRSLEELAQSPEESCEEPLFAWEEDASLLGPGQRLASRVEYERLLARARAEEHQARVAAEVERAQAEREAPSPKEHEERVAAEVERVQEERAAPFPAERERPEPSPAPVGKRRAVPPRRAALRLTWGAVAGLACLAIHAWKPWHWGTDEQPEEVAQPAPEEDSRDAGTVGVGETPLPVPARVTSAESGEGNIGLDMPKKPLPGQRGPPCKSPAIEIHGGCWLSPAENATPPCGDQAYEWKKRCYWPIVGPQEPATADAP